MIDGASRPGGAGGAGAVPDRCCSPRPIRRGAAARRRRCCWRGSTGCSAIGALAEARALIDARRAGDARAVPALVRHRHPARRRRRALRGAPAEPVAVADAAGAGLLPGARRRLERRRDHPDARRGGRARSAPTQQALLARFLDPALFEEEPEPPVPEPLTALDFLMREAVGLPRPPGPLPLAFLHMDLDEHVPMRTRAEAAERLVLVGRRRGAGAVRGLPVGRAGGLGRGLGPGAGGAGARRGAGRRRRRVGPALRRRRRGAGGARAAGRAGRGLRRAGWRRSTRQRSTPERAAGAGRAAAARRRGRGGARRGRRAGARRRAWPRCWRSPGRATRRLAPGDDRAAAALAGLAATDAGRRPRGGARGDAGRGAAGRGDPRGARRWCRPGRPSTRRRCARRC